MDLSNIFAFVGLGTTIEDSVSLNPADLSRARVLTFESHGANFLDHSILSFRQGREYFLELQWQGSEKLSYLPETFRERVELLE